jgi:hypothetical protein
MDLPDRRLDRSLSDRALLPCQDVLIPAADPVPSRSNKDPCIAVDPESAMNTIVSPATLKRRASVMNE